MQSLISDLLAYARIGSKEADLKPVDSEAIIKHAISNLQISIENSGAVITHDSQPTITVDQVQFVQLFQNLIGNAIKFCTDSSPHIHISSEQKENEWLFSVSDNGIGIAPDDTERIFEIFQRLHSTSKYPGTGIGLAICKKIVDRHGGRIWVEAEMGKGSTFYFTIPDKKE
ncbi:MAG: GHKL domain-containing protein [Candidatus Schekmanbacteria bacterium]|nr:GHKL domain-containing protein [Candidatus Schekmanbacteria bacterium]